MTPARTVRLRFLGGASIRVDDRTLSGPAAQRHRLALLALLAAAHPRGRRREKLVAYLWPARDIRRGRNLLSQAVHHLRNALGEGSIVSSGDELVLDGGAAVCDAIAFEEALDGGRRRDAVALYGGPFLDGFHLSDAVEFERWVDAERRRLVDRYRRCLEELAVDAADAGRRNEAVRWWKRRAAADPLNSRVAARLIEALAGEGNVGGALAHARRHERLLREKLGAAPPDELRSLVDRIAGRPEGPGPDASGSGPGGTTSTGGDAGVTPLRRRREPGTSEPAGGPPAPAPDAEATGGGAGNGRGGPDSTPLPGSGGLRPGRTAVRWGLAGLAVLALAVLARLLANGDGDIRPPAAAAPESRRPAVVVLPFANLGAAGDEHFADGITEELIVRLASASGLRVIARTSALRYRDDPADVREIGEDLGVDYVVEGTVRWEGGDGDESRVRITAQLVRTSDGTHLWGETFDRELGAVFAVQDEIAGRVVRALDVALPEEGRAVTGRRPTADLDAYAHYLQGNAYLARQFSEEGVRDAIVQYERAVEHDPGFAAALRRLIHARLWLTWVLGDTEQGLRARDEVRRLEAISDGDDPEARLGRGWYLYYGERRYEDALREFEAVLRARPGDGEVLRVVGFLQQRLGRTTEALATMKEALELSPRDAELAFAVARTLHWTGRYDEALPYYERAFSLAPEEDVGFLQSSLEHLHLARGDTLRARRVRERARDLGAGAWQGGRAELYSRDVRRAARRIRELPAGSVGGLFRHDNLAVAYARIGDEERRAVHADSLLELASDLGPESWDRPRAQGASSGWVFSGLALLHLGETEAGLRRVRRGLELESAFDDALVGPYLNALAARAYTRAGRTARALDLLERARAAPGVLTRHDLRRDPEWDPLRKEPRFRRLVEGGGAKHDPG